MQLTEKTQRALLDYERSHRDRRTLQKKIRDDLKEDAAVQAAKEARAIASEAYKTAMQTFKARHAEDYELLEEKQRIEAGDKELFDTLYIQASAESIANTGAVQLSLFSDTGRKVEVELVTKIKVSKDAPEEEQPKEDVTDTPDAA